MEKEATMNERKKRLKKKMKNQEKIQYERNNSTK